MRIMRSAAALALIALTGPAFAGPRLSQENPPPATGGGVQPRDADERGLWMQVDDAERQLKTSNFVIRDPALNAYVHQVLCRTAGEEACGSIRIYITRTPYFNANIAPNGMMQIWSGLFLRLHDEAQLAAVIGHEYVHYRDRHTLQLFREVKSKTNAMAWLAIVPAAGLIASGAALAATIGMSGSLFSFSRDMERAADAGSIDLLAKAGYDPMAASRIWEQIKAEGEATAAERKRKAPGNGGMFATHPADAERMTTLRALAEKAAAPNATDLGTDRYRAALAPFRASFIQDQLNLNDFGGTELLLGQMGTREWTSDLLFARGELYRSRGLPDDFPKAAGFYRDAIAKGDALPEARRGLGMALLRSGQTADGKAALIEYLKLRPDAKDRAMINMMAGGS